MQFKYPELLWGLLLLIIPIIIHLFQLRRFKRTPFTNVKMLKKVVSESRRSKTLKKWLILISRLGLFACLILAFSQPFSANMNTLRTQETVFYLDNSFSMQASTESGTQLQNTIQQFIQNAPKNSRFSLFTNDQEFENVEIGDIQNELINLSPSVSQLSIDQILLKTTTFFSRNEESLKRSILISDFQENMGALPQNFDNSEIYLIQQKVPDLTNVSIDSVFISNTTNEVIELTSLLSSNYNLESYAVSLYNDDKLIAKTAAAFNNSTNAQVIFSIPTNTPINGRIVISDKGLPYDNEFYFTIEKPEKIKILAITNIEADFLKRIFNEEEYDLTLTPLNQVNYSSLEEFNLIVLNELEEIPSGLVTNINTFTQDGGSLLIIPAKDIDITTYNTLSSQYYNTKFIQGVPQESAISKIAFEHPIYADVFNNSVTNFQYPKVLGYYDIATNGLTALSFQNNKPFLIGNGNAFFFTAAINLDNSNFKNSPLIVPTFYNIARNSLKLPQLYHTIGKNEDIEIPISLSKDNILKVVKSDLEFIPQQRSLPKKVSLTFVENPTENGIFQIVNNDKTIGKISFNYDRKESELNYLNVENLENVKVFDSITNFFGDLQKTNHINEFWKWFAILALVFVLIETALQRFLK